MLSSEEAQVFTVLVSGVAGLLFGSFLNVAVYRLPLHMSVVEPPSHCPSCEAHLTPFDLVPVLSWLWLRGRCRHCGASISVRYPLVELSTGLLCAASAAAIGSVWPLPSVALVLVCTLGAAAVDADGGTVPAAFALVAALAAFSLLPIALGLGHPTRIGWGALGALLGAAGAFAGDRSGEPQRWVRILLLACLAWGAGWLWPGGGPLVAAWIVIATAATGLGAARTAARRVVRQVRRRAPLALLAAGSVVGVLVSAAISRP